MRYYISVELDGKTAKVVKSTNKRNKVEWSYKRNAIKGFIGGVIYKFGWLHDYVEIGKPFNANIFLVDNTTNAVICKAKIHNDEKYMYVPRYTITPIDPIAKEYYKTN